MFKIFKKKTISVPLPKSSKQKKPSFFFAAIFFAVILGVVILTKFILAWSDPTTVPGVGEGILHSSGGNIGIGIALPGQKLSVAGVIESTAGGFKFPDGSILATGNKGKQLFTSTGTFTTPAGTTKVWVTGCGGGGGGGGGASGESDSYGDACSYGGDGGHGGKGAGVFFYELTVSPSTTYTVTVGDGGAAGAGRSSPTAGTAGVAGTATSFGGILSLGGGGRGLGGPDNSGCSEIGDGASGSDASNSYGSNIYFLIGYCGGGSGGGGSYGNGTGGNGGAGQQGVLMVEW